MAFCSHEGQWWVIYEDTDEAEVIAAFNAGRDPERLAMKYKAMRRNAFVFLRGTCHLFYAGLPADPLLRDAPPPGPAATCTWRTTAATRATTASSIST